MMKDFNSLEPALTVNELLGTPVGYWSPPLCTITMGHEVCQVFV